jgi:hypothetical protein
MLDSINFGETCCLPTFVSRIEAFSLKNSNLHSTLIHTASAKAKTTFTQSLGHNSLQPSVSFGTRSRLEIGTFDRAFSSSGSVRRNSPDVFRFNLANRGRLRIYLGNQFSNPNSNNRQMTVDLLNDQNLRRIGTTTVTPTRVNVINQVINPGTYRIRISTQSNDRGRYFLDMIRV